VLGELAAVPAGGEAVDDDPADGAGPRCGAVRGAVSFVVDPGAEAVVDGFEVVDGFGVVVAVVGDLGVAVGVVVAEVVAVGWGGAVGCGVVAASDVPEFRGGPRLEDGLPRFAEEAAESGASGVAAGSSTAAGVAPGWLVGGAAAISGAGCDCGSGR